MSNILELILMTLVFLTLVAFWVQTFGVVNITPSNKIKGGFILATIHIVISLLTALEIQLNYLSALYEMQSLFIVLSMLMAIFWLFDLYGLIKNKNTPVYEVNLHSYDYEIVVQGSVYIMDCSSTLGQDFPGFSNFLVCNDGNIILLSGAPLKSKHDIRCFVKPMPQFGSNVYACTDLKILDKPSKTDKFNKFLTAWIILNSIALCFLFSYMMIYIPLPWVKGMDPLVDSFMERTFGVAISVLGGCFVKTGYTTNEKIYKLILNGLGAFFLIDGLLLILGIL